MSGTAVQAREPSRWRVGMVIGGKYALLSLRGEGGEGPLFEAQNTWTGRRVAIKLLHARLGRNEHSIARFLDQARTATRLEHPHIVDVLDIGQDQSDGSYFIVQEFLRGHDLRALIDRQQLDPAQALNLLVPIIAALIAVHDHGIVHRDLKPENIFLAKNALGTVVPKLIDFGVARAVSTVTKSVAHHERGVGTIEYASPEQVRGDMLDARADVWSMGVVFYEVIGWKRPFDGADEGAVVANILRLDPPGLEQLNPAVSSDFASVIAQALHRDRDRRWPSMRDFLQALLECPSIPGEEIRARHRAVLGSLAPPKPSTASRPSEAPRPGNRTISVIDLDAAQSLGAGRLQSELGLESGSRATTDGLAAAAERALQTNALDEAIADAERAIRRAIGTPGVTARMRLVQAVAHRWRGAHVDAARCAFEAMELHPRGSAPWFESVGELAVASGAIGERDRLGSLAAAILGVEPSDGEAAAARLVAAFRIAAWLLRTGQTERSESVRAAVAEGAAALGPREPLVRAWYEVIGAEIGSHQGDPGASIEHLQRAVDAFAEAGDARSACVQRQNLANQYIQLGAYAEADVALVEVLKAALAMKLEMASVVKANHAVVLARIGDVAAAAQKAREAVDELVARGNRRAEAFCRIYLAGILSFQKDFVAAEDEARAAIVAASSAPEARAYAFATLGALLLRQKKLHEAHEVASRAMEIMISIGGVSEGESLIRLVHAVSLRALKRHDEAEAALDVAVARLRERAERISDERWRKSFLENIAENASTLARAGKRDEVG
ncbi:MAG: serine/threonine protein kinase [Deltaproteobacteria bacterium]|nr:serine/threonine protein kinase [Deltaproteobacteria bacterium]